MKTSDSIDKLAEALSLAQGQIKPAPKDATNPFFKSTYATLDSVWGACREPLSKNGLSIIQVPQTSKDGQLWLITRLMHSSGQWVESRFPITPDKANNIQSIGSALTYVRRYALSAIVGTTTDEDDDGNAEVQRQQKPSQNKEQAEKMSRPFEPKQLKDYMVKRAVGLGDSVPDDKLKRATYASLGNITNNNDMARRTILKYFFDIDSVESATSGQCQTLVNWVDAHKPDYQPNHYTVQEVQKVLNEAESVLRESELKGELFPEDDYQEHLEQTL